ncbi:MAG: methyltransferase domain-containing protein [Cellulosilyticaceae bacterium]
MKFYEELANYYEEVFPKGKMQVEFLEQMVGQAPQKVIDIACGNGVYGIHLAKMGHKVLLLDLSEAMIRKTKELAVQEGVEIETQVCSMLGLKDIVNSRYNVAFCIGNSLVHLDSTGEVESFMQEAYSLLEMGGKLILQIINYDRVLDQNVIGLPTVENKEKDLTFQRDYVLNEDSEKVEFKTILKAGSTSLENSVELLALRGSELIRIMQQTGFRIIGSYGSFKQEAYDPVESVHCIVVGEK